MRVSKDWYEKRYTRQDDVLFQAIEDLNQIIGGKQKGSSEEGIMVAKRIRGWITSCYSQGSHTQAKVDVDDDILNVFFSIPEILSMLEEQHGSDADIRDYRIKRKDVSKDFALDNLEFKRAKSSLT